MNLIFIIAKKKTKKKLYKRKVRTYWLIPIIFKKIIYFFYFSIEKSIFKILILLMHIIR